MTTVLTLAPIVLTGAGCGLALVASRAGAARTYALAKALASAGFVALAVALGSYRSAWSAYVLAGLVLAACGDVALGVPGQRPFRIGMACFAGGYALYVAGFVVRGLSPVAIWASLAAVNALVALAWRALGTRVPADLRAPVAVYTAVVAAMLTTGVASGALHGSLPLCVGALFVAASDVAVAAERFGGASARVKVVGLPAYYLGQTLIALALAA